MRKYSHKTMFFIFHGEIRVWGFLVLFCLVEIQICQLCFDPVVLGGHFSSQWNTSDVDIPLSFIGKGFDLYVCHFKSTGTINSFILELIISFVSSLDFLFIPSFFGSLLFNCKEKSKRK